MKEKLTDEIGQQLIKANQQGETGKALEFDPQTGELVVRQKDQIVNPDATILDQIATDGFA